MFKRALVLSAGLLSLMLLAHDAEAFWYARGWRGGVAVGGFRPPAVVTPYYLHGCLRCAPYYHPAIAAALAARAAAMAGGAAAGAAAGAAPPPPAADTPAGPMPQTATAAPTPSGQASGDDAASTSSNSASPKSADASPSAAPSDKDKASACAAGLSKDSKAIYDATAPHVTNLSALKNAIVTSTRQLAMSGRIAQATAKSSAQAAGKCLELLAGN
jgi:hypothetical protein